MQFQTIFNQYYTLYRGDSDVPLQTDPEWAIAVRYANVALKRLTHVDGELWDWLWTDTATQGETQTYTTSSTLPVITTYSCPVNMLLPGGWIKLTDPVSGGTTMIDVVPPYTVQTKSGNLPFAYFTGDAQTGFTLNISLTGTTFVGFTINYPYYRKLTYFNDGYGPYAGVAEDGTTVSECPDANFIINTILAYRFRSTRNYPSYDIAHNDAETALSGMQIKNHMGVNGHTWNSLDGGSGSFGLGF